MRKIVMAVTAAIAMSLNMSGARAGVTIGGTRVLSEGGANEVTVQLGNDGNVPAWVQVWLDMGNPNARPDESKVPFTLSPPAFRLDPKRSRNLRFVRTQGAQDGLPQDRESLLWLNVAERTAQDDRAADADRDDGQSLQRSRIRLVFRPAGLSGDAAAAAAGIAWKFVRKERGGYALEAVNPTPHYVAFDRLVARSGGVTWMNDRSGVVDSRSRESTVQ